MFVLNKIVVPIFQINYIQIKTVDPKVNVGLEQRLKVQTRLQGPFYFLTLTFGLKFTIWSELHERKMRYAGVQINSALISFTPCFCAITRQL